MCISERRRTDLRQQACVRQRLPGLWVPQPQHVGAQALVCPRRLVALQTHGAKLRSSPSSPCFRSLPAHMLVEQRRTHLYAATVVRAPTATRKRTLRCRMSASRPPAGAGEYPQRMEGAAETESLQFSRVHLALPHVRQQAAHDALELSEVGKGMPSLLQKRRVQGFATDILGMFKQGAVGPRVVQLPLELPLEPPPFS